MRMRMRAMMMVSIEDDDIMDGDEDDDVLKFTSVVDNVTTVHDHTYTVAFSLSVLIKCSICPSHQTLTRTP